MTKRLSCSRGQNNLISTLSAADRALLDPYLVPVDLHRHKVLEEPDTEIRKVYFPMSGIGSTLAVASEGRRTEVGLFGREGMLGTAIPLEADRAPNEILIQAPGHGFCIEADQLRDVVTQSPSLRRHLLRYTHALLIQAGQTALSNGQAKLEERLARWLLMCHDRTDGDEMTLTHELLAMMLGVRRAGVTVATHTLEGKGMIRAGRGVITVLDRKGWKTKRGNPTACRKRFTNVCSDGPGPPRMAQLAEPRFSRRNDAKPGPFTHTSFRPPGQSGKLEEPDASARTGANSTVVAEHRTARRSPAPGYGPEDRTAGRRGPASAVPNRRTGTLSRNRRHPWGSRSAQGSGRDALTLWNERIRCRQTA